MQKKSSAIITKSGTHVMHITDPGEHLFFFENLSLQLSFVISHQDAVIIVNGVYHGHNNDHFTLSILQHHISPRSTSKISVKSVLDDASHLSVTDLIRIDPAAKNATAHFANKNILLSSQAHAVSMPQMDVVPSTVHCTHTVQTTPLDRSQLHYLCSRGIVKDDAQDLLIRGFLSDMYPTK